MMMAATLWSYDVAKNDMSTTNQASDRDYHCYGLTKPNDTLTWQFIDDTDEEQPTESWPRNMLDAKVYGQIIADRVFDPSHKFNGEVTPE